MLIFSTIPFALKTLLKCFLWYFIYVGGKYIEINNFALLPRRIADHHPFICE